MISHIQASPRIEFTLSGSFLFFVCFVSLLSDSLFTVWKIKACKISIRSLNTQKNQYKHQSLSGTQVFSLKREFPLLSWIGLTTHQMVWFCCRFSSQYSRTNTSTKVCPALKFSAQRGNFLY